MPYHHEYDIALNAVRAASAICARVQAAMKPATLIKGDRSPVTVADYASQAIICRRLMEAFPDDVILAEEHSLDLLEGKMPGMADELVGLIREQEAPGATLEDICAWIDCSGRNAARGRTWILDPIDGTKGFIRGEQYAIALALMAEGRLELGLLGCPNIAYDGDRVGCVFAARKGAGAKQLWLGEPARERAIEVSKDADGPSMTFVESVEAAHADHGVHQALCRDLGVTRQPVRIDSQAKYAVVARGEASAYLRLQPDPEYRQKVWDHAAGCVVIEEAGGRVSDENGKALDFGCGARLENNIGVIVTNGACHDALLEAISKQAKRA
ncbi:MAG TPA: 3'(2'),5'-bisphosphate nucleotidase [Rhodospirillales bacterium]|nr:3'(2'),5'-bisphosphate nucleotidase [Rhodospirillales bacterium]